MSAVVRAALAAAANTVEGISASPYFWQNARAGSAMVRFDRTEYPNRLGGVTTWALWVMIPQDIASAEKYLDEKIPALVEALSAEMAVKRVTPQTFVFDAGQVSGVSVEGIRETE